MMLDALLKYLNEYVQLSENEYLTFFDKFRPLKLKKKEHFIKAGERCKRVLFFQEGYFRFYHIDVKGQEVTTDFSFAPGFITSYTSFITGNPSFVNVQAMEEMNILELSRHDLYDFYAKFPSIERVGRLIAETVAMNYEKHLLLIINQSAETRYRNLLKNYPEFIMNIPLQYIASYLGITQETLSRMRKSIQ